MPSTHARARIGSPTRIPVIELDGNGNVVGYSSVPAAGGGGGLTPYEFTQSAAATTWTISHNLGYNPGVNVVDTAGTRITGFGCIYPNTNTAVLTFAAAFSGTASLI